MMSNLVKGQTAMRSSGIVVSRDTAVAPRRVHRLSPFLKLPPGSQQHEALAVGYIKHVGDSRRQHCHSPRPGFH